MAASTSDHLRDHLAERRTAALHRLWPSADTEPTPDPEPQGDEPA